MRAQGAVDISDQLLRGPHIGRRMHAVGRLLGRADQSRRDERIGRQLVAGDVFFGLRVPFMKQGRFGYVAGPSLVKMWGPKRAAWMTPLRTR